MNGKIALIGVLADDVPALRDFYGDVLGFEVQQDLGSYVEFHSPGVRFALCTRAVMAEATGHASFQDRRRGQCFELAFPVDAPEDVDRTYDAIVDRGAAPVKGPADMPWGQRAAFFADPEGNVHELFAELPQP